MSPAYVEQKYKVENSTADVNFIIFDAAKIDNKTVQVSDQDIAAYYEKYKQYYKQKPSRKIKYVAFALEPSARDSATLHRKISQLQDSISRSFFCPSSAIRSLNYPTSQMAARLTTSLL